MSGEQTLRLAVCLFPGMAMLDYIGPVEFLDGLSARSVKLFSQQDPTFSKTKIFVETIFVAPTAAPVEAMNHQRVTPDAVYGEVREQFDLILIPGGSFMSADELDPSLLKFLESQIPGAKHVLTVCVGSWVLAASGQLPPGTKATTNKAGFKRVEAATADKKIQWVPKARWVADDSKKFWTGSGLSAGFDLAYGFMQHLVGTELADAFARILEFKPKTEGDDEFAAVYGLA